MKSVTTTTIELIEKEIAAKYLLHIRQMVQAIRTHEEDMLGPSVQRTAANAVSDAVDFIDAKIADVEAFRFLPRSTRPSHDPPHRQARRAERHAEDDQAAVPNVRMRDVF